MYHVEHFCYQKRLLLFFSAEFVEATLEQDIVQATIVNPMGPKKMLIEEI